MKTGLQLDTTKWDSYIKKVRDKVDKDLEMLVAQTTTNISFRAKSFAPTDKRGEKYKKTGARLKTSIRTYHKKKEGEVRVGVDYSAYVEFGTGSKVIVPTELKDYAMQFKGKGIRQVNNRAQPYLYPAFFIERAKFISNMNKLIDRAK